MKNITKKLFIIVGIILLLIFAVPLSAGILNIGNMFGICVGVILIIIGRFLDKLLKLNRIIIRAFCIIAVAGLCLFTTTMGLIISGTHAKPTEQATLIVLGCKVRGEEPSLQLYQRTKAGADYLNGNPDAVAILCGGQGNGENISEAECMKRIMQENGIDENRLYLEDKSTSTEENIMFAKNILDENHLDYNVVIATSDYHCYRAKLIAKKHGLRAAALPAYADKFTRPTFYTREVFGVWLQWLKAI